MINAIKDPRKARLAAIKIELEQQLELLAQLRNTLEDAEQRLFDLLREQQVLKEEGKSKKPNQKRSKTTQGENDHD